MPHVRSVDPGSAERLSQENSGPCWRKAGRPGHSAARAPLRSDSGRSRPRFQALRSPLRLLAAAQPRLGCCPPRTAASDGQTPADTRPRRHGRVAAGPGLIAPCPTPGPAPARTRPRSASGQGRAYRLEPLRQVQAGHPFGHAHHAPPRRPDRSSAQQCGIAFHIYCSGWSAGSWTCCSSRLGGGLAQRRAPTALSPPPDNQVAVCQAARSSGTTPIGSICCA
jgi:hypothetical protein